MSSSKAERRIGCLLAALAVATLASCASGGAARAARLSERQQDYDRAVIEYAAALKQRPNDVDLRVALDRVKIRASLDHFAKGRHLAGTGKLEEGLQELQVAAELNPSLSLIHI